MKIPSDVRLARVFSEQGVDCYRLNGGNYINEYYVISEAGTRHLMISPEVIGYDVYKCLVQSTSQMLYFLKENNKITTANILTILRGGLNYPLEESCHKEHIRVHDMSFLSCERVFHDDRISGLEIKYDKMTVVDGSTLLIGDIVASGETLIHCFRYLVDFYRKHNAALRNIVIFTIGGTKAIGLLEKFTQEVREFWPDFEGFECIFYEGVFGCYEDHGVSGINRIDVDFGWNNGIVSPEFRRETLSMRNPLFEKCIIYDGGARRYEIHDHIDEVLDFWKYMRDHGKEINMDELLAEKLGHPLTLTYQEWLEATHYQDIEYKISKWLYGQERGYIKGLDGVTVDSIAAERIEEFSAALKKYMI